MVSSWHTAAGVSIRLRRGYGGQAPLDMASYRPGWGETVIWMRLRNFTGFPSARAG